MKKIIRIRHFPTEEACLQYLSEKKWADGFVCPVCGHKHFSSPTSGNNRHIMKRGIFENLLAKVIAHPPKTYKLLYA